MKAIKSGGNDYPLHYGMLELEQYEELSEEPIGNLFSRIAGMAGKEGELMFPFSAKEIINITLTGLNGGARKAKNNNEYTREQASEILEDGNGLAVQVLQIFAESLAKSIGGEAKSDDEGNAPSPKGRSSKKK